MFILLFCIASILTYLSWTDITARTISNLVVLILIPFLLAFAWLNYGEIFIFPALFTLIIGFFLFLLKIIGAGDIKLLTVLMLAIPATEVINFLFLTSFFGLLLVIFGWLFWRQSIKTKGLPYGVAISLGFLSHFWLIY